MEIVKGDKVNYRIWTRPYTMVSGTVENVEPDTGGRKKFKYTIKPDKPSGKYKGLITRYHPNEGLNQMGQMIEPSLEDVFGKVTEDKF